jgi:hypothetical protein
MEEHSKELNKGSINHSDPGHSINASTPSTQPRKKKLKFPSKPALPREDVLKHQLQTTHRLHPSQIRPR